MSDFRMSFLKSVEQSLISLIDDPTTLKEAVDRITILLSDYELSERCTDLVPTENKNAKILKTYCACLLVDGKSQKTVYQYRRSVQRLADFVEKDFTDMGAYDIRYFLASEKSRGVSDRTLENQRANLSAFFQWMSIEELIPKNPMLSINPIKYPDEIRKEFSDVEIDRLKFACRSEKEIALIEFLLASGVRVSELSEMDVKDVDFQTMDVHVIHAKGAHERITYITPVALDKLKRYLSSRPAEESQCLFYNSNHTRLEPGGIRHILKEIASRSGVENVHPHRFRRTFATKLAKRGMDVREIQRLLGHKNINTTMEYVNMDDESVKSSYRKYIA